MKAIDRLFERMAATYGAQWTRMWGDVPIGDVKTAWAHELSPYAQRLESVAWALENLPPKVPNVIEFKMICRQAPLPPEKQLPAPKADPERLARELSKLADMKKQAKSYAIDHKAWAKRLIEMSDQGIKVRPICLRFAKDALRIKDEV